MKTSNYIYGSFNERGMKSFEKRISAVLKKHGLKGDAIAIDAGMERSSGRGSYNKYAIIKINNEEYTLNSHTHDAMLWDSFEGTPKERRQMFEAVLNENVETLVEEVTENESY